MIEPLTADTPERIDRLGGKGCGLVRLLRCGARVPPAWLVGEEVDDDELARWWRTGGETEVAVRSSATAEDLAGASFAGVYDTYLGVASAAALCDAVRACRAGLHGERAVAYRRQRGLGDDVHMPVIVQRMVHAEVAGVMQTANPQRPFAAEIVIEAARGLGEAVVSGVVQPDWFALDRASGAVREVRVPGGDAPCLGDAQLAALAGLAHAVDRALGPNQDIEWAFAGDALWALQQRPMTGLPPAKPREVWTRRFGDEYLADYTMPLGDTLLTDWIREAFLREMAVLMGRRDLAEREALRRYQGYVYLSGAYMARMMSAVPASLRPAEDWFGPAWAEQLRAVPFAPRHALGMIAAPWRDRRGPLPANLRALDRHRRAVERAVLPRLDQDYDRLSPAEWRDQLEEARELGREHFRVIRWGMGFHNPLLHALTRHLLARWADDHDGGLYEGLVSGLPGTRTAEINRELWRLGAIARAEPAMAARLRAGEDYARLRADTGAAALWPAFDGFLARHGHRAATREVSQPRWVETPEVVLGLVRAQLGAGEPPPDPALLEAEVVARRRDLERDVLARVGPLRRPLLRRLLRTTRRLTRYREDQRYHLDYLLLHVRRLLLAQARRLHAAGALADPFELFFLEADELLRLVADPTPAAALRARIDERRDHYRRWKDRLPATFLYDDVETEGELGGDAADGDAVGLGASRGVARGRSRVIRDLAGLAAVEPGEILVANNIDPGWTSVFPVVAGLITETGGLLSHGALLAREYGVPAVMGVPGATARFPTGTLLEIDGARGSVSCRAAGG